MHVRGNKYGGKCSFPWGDIMINVGGYLEYHDDDIMDVNDPPWWLFVHQFLFVDCLFSFDIEC